jgi:hypothetical protein
MEQSNAFCLVAARTVLRCQGLVCPPLTQPANPSKCIAMRLVAKMPLILLFLCASSWGAVTPYQYWTRYIQYDGIFNHVFASLLAETQPSLGMFNEDEVWRAFKEVSHSNEFFELLAERIREHTDGKIRMVAKQDSSPTCFDTMLGGSTRYFYLVSDKGRRDLRFDQSSEGVRLSEPLKE